MLYNERAFWVGIYASPPEKTRAPSRTLRARERTSRARKSTLRAPEALLRGPPILKSAVSGRTGKPRINEIAMKYRAIWPADVANLW
jgi:hypothetical protein